MEKKDLLWEQLFNENYHKIYGFFMKKLGSPEDAADASQETFMRVIRRDGTTALDSPAGYIWRTTQNLVKEIKRTRAVHARWMTSHPIDFDKEISQTPDPEEAMKIQQMNDNILDVLNKLPPRRREVFILHRFKGLSHKEIAKQLSISPKTVENHMVNALLFLRKHLSRP